MGEIVTWDFQTALGDTIKEKYANQFIKVIEVSNVMRRDMKGIKWIENPFKENSKAIREIEVWYLSAGLDTK